MFTNNATMAYYLLSINTGHREFYCSILHGISHTIIYLTNNLYKRIWDEFRRFIALSFILTIF